MSTLYSRAAHPLEHPVLYRLRTWGTDVTAAAAEKNAAKND